jgi:hypothetical protein
MTYYRVTQSYLETCYVERDVLVEADSPGEALEKALDDDILDTGEEHCCEPQESFDFAIAKDYNGDPSAPVEDQAWGKRYEKWHP